jgi:hypothetical protein
MAVSLRLRLVLNVKTEDRQAVIPTRPCKSLTSDHRWSRKVGRPFLIDSAAYCVEGGR